MPSNVIARIKSAPKRVWWGIVGISLLLVAIGGSLLVALWPKAVPLRPPTVSLAVGSDAQTYTYHLSAARTAAEQEQGLSNTTGLRSDQGMIFINQTSTKRCFWMRNMRYAIDIIWLDSAKKVVDVERNVSPDSYPQAFCAEGQYVVELKAGEAAKRSIQVGQTLSF